MSPAHTSNPIPTSPSIAPIEKDQWDFYPTHWVMTGLVICYCFDTIRNDVDNWKFDGFRWPRRQGSTERKKGIVSPSIFCGFYWGRQMDSERSISLLWQIYLIWFFLPRYKPEATADRGGKTIFGWCANGRKKRETETKRSGGAKVHALHFLNHRLNHNDGEQ